MLHALEDSLSELAVDDAGPARPGSHG
jgi:hypothetical protein